MTKLISTFRNFANAPNLSIKDNNDLMLFRKIITVYTDNHRKH
jgi:hypothetical protein